MFYLSLIAGFGLGIDQSPFTLHENYHRILIGSGGTLSMHRAGMGL